jgi:flagellar protein FlaG
MINEIVNSGFLAKPPAPSNGRAAVAIVAPGNSASAAKPEKTEKPSTEQLQSAVRKLNDYVQNVQRTLSFSVDEDTGVTVVRVIDTETKELVRQIPAEETLALAAAINEQTANIFVQEKV